jgi:dTDP-4-dehydrorhamnose 3,5-epimerase
VAIELTPEAQRALRYQRYEPQPRIAGVEVYPLTKHRALEGWFMELARFGEGRFLRPELPMALEQLSLSRAEPGRLNAFHLHPKRPQHEAWCVLAGGLLVWLVDLRADSPTREVKRRHVLSAEVPELLFIPAGVAHGYKAGPAGALLLYAASEAFKPDDPNEGRLPWDFFGPELWEEERG